MSLGRHLPPPKIVTSCLTLPPSNSHNDIGLLLHTTCTALLVLPPPISSQPILGIMLFLSATQLSAIFMAMYEFFDSSKKNCLNFLCLCSCQVGHFCDYKCIKVNIFPLFLKLWICHIILCNVLCSLEKFILDKSIHIRTAFQ